MRIFIALLFTLGSCTSKTPHPETVLGIKLGLPTTQVLEAVNSGNLKLENDESYIDYGKFKGYLTLDTSPSSDGMLVDAVRLKFQKKGSENPNNGTSKFISQLNMIDIITSYETKYGKPKNPPEKNSPTQVREWEVGDLHIQLHTARWGDEQHCEAQVLYDFTSRAYERFKRNVEKRNKTI